MKGKRLWETFFYLEVTDTANFAQPAHIQTSIKWHNDKNDGDGDSNDDGDDDGADDSDDDDG